MDPTIDPKALRLQRALKKLADAQGEYDAALLDLCQNGPRGSQQAATRITGLTREALRLRVRKIEAGQPATPAARDGEAA
ncbi:hypothetical protein [Streptacidiphilus rugosus]|uniref:hypothetical protein n=1 Tax=Streptacidiphilus rugosus TaxID=405783 RepID=UPI00056CE167|nr:hypothetical protein [Streptacidiphilus rugosus]